MKKNKLKRKPRRRSVIALYLLVSIALAFTSINFVSRLVERVYVDLLTQSYAVPRNSNLIAYANGIDTTQFSETTVVVNEWQWVDPLYGTGELCGIQYGGILTELPMSSNSNENTVTALYSHMYTRGTACDSGIVVAFERHIFEGMTSEFLNTRAMLSEREAVVSELLKNAPRSGDMVVVTKWNWLDIVNPGHDLHDICGTEVGSTLHEINRNDLFVLAVYGGFNTAGTRCDNGSLFLFPILEWESQQ